MAIWELICEAVSEAHATGREWLTVGEITREVLAREPSTNTGTIHAYVRYLSINDPSKKHSQGLLYRNNPRFITDEPTVHGKRYRLLTEQERQTFLQNQRDDLEQYSYAQVLEWLSGVPVELESREEADEAGVVEEEIGEIAGTALVELHLQDYIYRTWDSIFPHLKLYQGTQGREFRTSDPSVGILDFLCVDQEGNFVVIETKRDVATRRAIGQIASYMGWVREKLCQDDQHVSGILVASAPTDELRLAASSVSGLSIYVYEISFSIRPM